MDTEPSSKPWTLDLSLLQDVRAWTSMGMPALLQRFVLKHGKTFSGRTLPRRYRRGPIKECFRNSAVALQKYSELEYYEGYAMSRKFQFPFLHAWNVADGKVVELTLRNPVDYEYYGVYFTRQQIWTQQAKTMVYGMLDIGVINIPLLRLIDNELVNEALDEALRFSRARSQGSTDDGMGAVA